MFGAGLFAIMLLISLIFAALLHFAVVPLFNNGLVHCLVSGIIFGVLNYIIATIYFRRYQKIKAENQMMERKLNIDNLTQLLNRRAFDQDVQQSKTGAGFAAIFIDIDNFHEFNNRFGHAIGDLVLTKVAQTIKSCVRFHDRVYRYGGEEIVVLLMDCSKTDAARVAEKIRSRVRDLDNMPYTQITVSLGVSAYPEDGSDIYKVLSASDRAMLAAKSRGKNRIELSAEHSLNQGLTH